MLPEPQPARLANPNKTRARRESGEAQAGTANDTIEASVIEQGYRLVEAAVIGQDFGQVEVVIAPDK